MLKALRNIVANEHSYITMNSYFEVSPFVPQFNSTIRKQLFRLLYNEQLFTHLNEEIDLRLKLGRIRSPKITTAANLYFKN